MRHKWQFKEQFPIQERMADVLRKTIEASEKQVDFYRRKLAKLQYK